MGPYHFILGSLLEPQDDLTQRLRKYATTLFFLQVSCLGLFTILLPTIMAFDGGFYSMIILFQNVSQTLCGVVCYMWLRKTHHVGDGQAALLLWWTLFNFILNMLMHPDADQALWAILLAQTAAFFCITRLPIFLVSCFIPALIAQWNVAHSTKSPEMMLVLPGYQIRSAMQVFIDNAIPTAIAALTVITFIVVIAESERRGKAQKAANEMTFEILELQRRYNTTKIAEVIAEYKSAEEVDAELLVLFDNMNANLESYRPFLPNYLFNNDDEEEVDPKRDENFSFDDEGSVPDLVSDVGSSYQTPASDEPNHRGPRKDSKGSIPRQTVLDHSSKASRASSSARRSHHLNSLSASIRHTGLTKRSDFFCGRIAFAFVDVNAEGLVPTDFGGKTSDVLKSVVHMIYTLAKETKASVHSMLGDTVQLTWNATSNVALPETKGAVFLARLAKRFQDHGGAALSLKAAISSGRATVHSLTTSNQQALLVEAAWLSTLEACFDLAKRVARAGSYGKGPTGSSVVLMDDQTATACHLEVEAAAVDVVYPASTEAELRRPTFLCHYSTDLDIRRSTSADASKPNASPATVHQLVREHQRADAEWMYQIQGESRADGSHEGDANTSANRLRLKALLLATDGRLSEALSALEASTSAGVAAGNNHDLNTPAATPVLSPIFFDALRAKCESENVDE